MQLGKHDFKPPQQRTPAANASSPLPLNEIPHATNHRYVHTSNKNERRLAMNFKVGGRERGPAVGVADGTVEDGERGGMLLYERAGLELREGSFEAYAVENKARPYHSSAIGKERGAEAVQPCQDSCSAVERRMRPKRQADSRIEA